MYSLLLRCVDQLCHGTMSDLLSHPYSQFLYEQLAVIVANSDARGIYNGTASKMPNTASLSMDAASVLHLAACTPIMLWGAALPACPSNDAH